MKINNKPRFFLIIAILAIAAFATFGKKTMNQVKNLIAPASSIQQNMAPEAKKAVDDGTPVINVCVVPWGGYIGGQYMNNGFAASTESRFYKEYGILVNFIIIDQTQASRDAFKSGAVDLLWITAGSIVTEIEGMQNENVRIVMQSDWSRGGDAIVAVYGIKNIQDLRGKKIAVALGTPSNSLLLKALEASNMRDTDVEIFSTDSAIDAANLFKAGQVDAAVVWSPDDQACKRAVTGSSIILSTKKAGNIIADVFYAKKAFLDKNHDAVAKLIEGWLRGAAEINSNPEAKNRAVKILAAGLNISDEDALESINNVRLTTLGDNLNFFGLNSDYRGVKGEDLYNQMRKMYMTTKPPLASANAPDWRSITDTSFIRSVKLSGFENDAEEVATFTAPTQKDESMPAYAGKPVSVTFASGSSELTSDGKIVIEMQFGNTAKVFRESRIRIEGNTDSVGSRAMNIKLSKARANAVADFLASKYGFDRNRFVIVGHGPDNPVSGCESNSTQDCQAKNRRTDFQLL